MFDDWIHEKFSANGGSGARGLRRALSGSGLKEAYRFGRETPQNTNDAARNQSELVRMIIRLRQLTGGERRSFQQYLRIQSLVSRGVLVPLPDPLPLLFVEDYGTLGLGGAERADEATETRKRNRYVGLCMTFGDASSDAVGGGTYGFGKSVLWNASESRIVLFHSRFDPDEMTNGVTSRLIGCALFDQHDYQQQRYTGRAFLGKTDASQDYTRPLTGKYADRAAANLGFPARPDVNMSGTSILIVNSHFCSTDHLGEIRKGIERYYWPRIIDGRLDVRFFIEDEELPAPDPESDPHLRPYIAAYRRALAVTEGRDVAVGESSWHGEIISSRQTLGVLALNGVEVPSASAGSQLFDVDEDDDRLIDTVALVRTPRMVVRYHPPYKRSVDHHFVGVFVADDDVNPLLARSEPPTHNLWDPNADELTTTGRQTVVAVTEGIKKKVKEFLARQHAREIEPSDACAVLDRELADLVKMIDDDQGRGQAGIGSRRNGDGSRVNSSTGTNRDHAPRPKPLFTFRFTEGPKIETDSEGRKRVAAKVTVNVVSSAERRASRGNTSRYKYIQMVIHPKILVDDGQFDDTELAVGSISSSDSDAIRGGDKIIFKLGEDPIEREFSVKTSPLEHDEQIIDLRITPNLLTRKPNLEAS
jgi:hypothetical protein